jgi:hypothetical protein
VGTSGLYDYNADIIRNLHPYPILIPANIENDVLLTREACLRITLFEIMWRFPIGVSDFDFPCLSLGASVWMLIFKDIENFFSC